MRTAIVALATIFMTSANASEIATLMKDNLKHGSAPGVIFTPTEKGGSPVLSDQKPRGHKGENPMAEPIHIEQMVDYVDHPSQDNSSGFVVIGWVLPVLPKHLFTHTKPESVWSRLKIQKYIYVTIKNKFKRTFD